MEAKSGITGGVQSCSSHLQGENEKNKTQLELTLATLVSDGQKRLFQVYQQQEAKEKNWTETCS